VSSCYLVLSLSCEFLKEGKATDEDMRSVASLGKDREKEIFNNFIAFLFYALE
jgi:hypothetical protein